MKCPRCNSEKTRREYTYGYWTGEKAWSCDDCEGRIFTQDDIDEGNENEVEEANGGD